VTTRVNLAVLLSLAVIDLWLIATGRETISQHVWAAADRAPYPVYGLGNPLGIAAIYLVWRERKPFGWLVMAGDGVLLGHWLWRF
jgi:hypothetical protein